MSERTARILLVEDNEGDAFLLSEMLSRDGSFDVLRADALRQALSLAAGDPCDLVLLDLSLPDSEGLSTVERMAQACPALPIVVLTELADSQIGVDALRIGAQDYLVKGLATQDSLSRSVKYAMERHSILRALHDARDLLEDKVRRRTADLATTVEELEGEVRQRLAVEAELRRTNKILHMVSECNQALVRYDDEPSLVQQVCQIILDEGGYTMAWVGYADEAARRVRPVAYVGMEQGYLEKVRITWDDSPLGQGPTGSAIRLGKPCFGRDFLTDPKLAPWREYAIERGFRSSVALPLSLGEQKLGALTIYAAESDAFDDAQVKILSELADDLASGIMALRTRTALRESQQYLTQVVHNAPVMIWAVDSNGVCTLADGKLEALGLPREQLIGRHIREIVGPHSPILDDVQRALTGQHVAADTEYSGIIFESASSPLRGEQGRIRGVICVGTDVTERRRAEREVLEATEREQRRIGRDLHDTIQGNLAGIGMMLNALANDLEKGEKPADQHARATKDIAEVVRQTLRQTRELARGLCPIELRGDGLRQSLEMLATTISSLFRVNCRFLCEDSFEAAEESTATQLYYIAQEAVNNSLKHARASQITIHAAKQDGELCVAVEDDGIGMPRGACPSTGLGLRTMGYRAKLIGAKLDIGPGEKSGTIVRCCLKQQ